MSHLVGIVGKKGVGKDTVALWFNKHHDAKLYSFAAPIKKFASEYMGLTYKQLHTLEGKEGYDPYWGTTPRRILQHIGSSMRSLPIEPKGSFWIKYLMRELDAIRDREEKEDVPVADRTLVVVSDVRYPNEASAIRERGGILIKVIRDTGLPEDLDSSEQQSDKIPCNITLNNDKSISDLYQELGTTFAKAFSDDFYKRNRK
jgi:hypothetical protein